MHLPVLRTIMWKLSPVAVGLLPILLFVQPGVLAGAQEVKPQTIPLCPGLTIVTAVRQPQGDYESIKRIESLGPDGVRIRYSSYRPDPMGDYDSTTVAPPPWLPFTVYRTVTTADLESAGQYMQQFAPEGVPEVVPGTTSLGISEALLRRLKSDGKIPLTVYQPILSSMPLKVNREPGEVDYRLPGEIARVESEPVAVSVLVNNRLVSLPTVHARGAFLWDEAEFFFLDEPKNPLALRFTIGQAQLRVIKISYDCDGTLLSGAGQPGGAGGTGDGVGIGGGGSGTGDGGSRPSAAAAALETALAESGKVDVYSIYFDFNSDRIREESEPTLKDIAAILRRHPDWRLAVNGHTDSIASDQYNLDLSSRRSAAVKNALTTTYQIDGQRLTTAGMGEAQPADTNETLEGRAKNRRVELVRR